MHRIYADHINSRDISLIFCDLLPQKITSYLLSLIFYLQYPTTIYPLRDAQKPGDSHRKTDTLLLVPLAQMRSGTYVDFRDGQPTIVNLVVVGD